MFSKNLKYYRLRNRLTKKDLAGRLGITPMAITHYENDRRKPDMVILKEMATVLNVRVSDFLVGRNEELVFFHGDFRGNVKYPAYRRDYVREATEHYINRFMTIVEVLGGNVLPLAPVSATLQLTGDLEQDAISLRKHLGQASEGPIGNLVELLENKGILVYACDIDDREFSGMNGFVNDRPFIVYNKNMSPERNRSTIGHELAHLMFDWPDEMEDSIVEETATAISGAFLFSKSDALRELGVHRTVISKDMLFVAKEYGISMMLLVVRAKTSGIITESLSRSFFIQASKKGWRTKEPVRIRKEVPLLFEQLVYRAINEREISPQKGAELLETSYDKIMARCCFDEN